METIRKGHFTLKRIFEENRERFVSSHRSDITFSAAYNVWKVMNCREPNGLGYTTFACPDHPDQITHIPRRGFDHGFIPRTIFMRGVEVGLFRYMNGESRMSNFYVRP